MIFERGNGCIRILMTQEMPIRRRDRMKSYSKIFMSIFALFLISVTGIGNKPKSWSGWIIWSLSPESPPIFPTRDKSCSATTANAHRGKIRKSEKTAGKLLIIEEEGWKIPLRGWAEMIRKVYQVDPLICPKCQGQMRIIAFITDHPVVDRILNHLKLTFVASKPPPPRIAYQEVLMAAEASSEYFS